MECRARPASLAPSLRWLVPPRLSQGTDGDDAARRQPFPGTLRLYPSTPVSSSSLPDSIAQSSVRMACGLPYAGREALQVSGKVWRIRCPARVPSDSSKLTRFADRRVETIPWILRPVA